MIARILLVVFLVGATVLLSFFWWRRGAVPTDAIRAEQCRAAYRNATTLTDSQMVDARRVGVGRGDAGGALTCGALKQEGLVR